MGAMTPRQKQGIMSIVTDSDGNFYYNDKLDGIWGPKSQSAAERFLKDFTGEETAGSSNADVGTFWDHIRYWRREEFRCRCGENHEPYCNGFPVEPDKTLVELVDDLRHHFGRPGHRSSGIRCPRHNADQPNAAEKSRHLSGKALDFFIEDVSGEELLAAAKADKRCRYAYIISGQYVHVDVE